MSDAPANPPANPFFMFSSALPSSSSSALAPSSSSSSSSSDDASGGGGGDGDGVVGGEAESTATYTPLVKLDQVAVQTGEEDDAEIYKQRAALYRFADSSGEWKERGKGDVKLLKNNKSGLIRILLRQDKTLKVCCNHTVQPSMGLRTNPGSDRSWVWRARDFAEEPPRDETFAIRFKDTDIAGQFQEAYNAARKANESVLGPSSSSSSSSSPSSPLKAPAPSSSDSSSSSPAPAATDQPKA